MSVDLKINLMLMKTSSRGYLFEEDPTRDPTWTQNEDNLGQYVLTLPGKRLS